MTNKILKAKSTNRAALIFAFFGVAGTIGALGVNLVSADTVNGQAMNLAPNVSAGSFDLTKQASGDLTFPVTFDRPSGVNAAALAGTVTQLGSSSQLYKSALEAVPELSNTAKMNSLLSDAMDSSSANNASAKETIVKLINWYNGLGGQKITTQSGDEYTVDNLNQPINVLAVAFSNNNSINEQSTTTLASINNASTVGDVMKALDAYKSGVSQPYQNAFDAYASKVYAQDANLNDLTQYSAIKPVLDAYESMYANGASAIRTSLLNGQSTSTEAGVTFFESAVIAGSTSNSGGDGSNSNTPSQDTTYTTKYVDENGNNVAPPETSKTGYGNQKDIDGYEYVEVKTDDGSNTKTYIYRPIAKSADTVWVDEQGNELKPKEDGTHPDNDGKSDIDGYVVISTKTTTDENGNTHTVNTYHKVASDTVWVDTEGNELKPKQDGEYPDNDGTSDIPGYKLVSVKTNTDKNGDRHIVNTYEKEPEQPSEKKVHTYWFDSDGNSLKDKEEGTFPDTDHNDIPGYTWKQTYTVTEDDLKDGGVFNGTSFEVGDTINIYDKTPDEKPDTKIVTHWVDEQGNKLKDDQDGSHPDTDGNDVPGYTLIRTETDEDGNVTNVYQKIPEKIPEVVTHWVDTEGNKLQDDQKGAHPDNDGKSDIDGYRLVRTDTDEDGNVTNVYEKLHTQWVDENGNELKPQEDGLFPDNDGESDIPGYELVDTVTDENGNIKNIYRKLPESQNPPSQPADPEPTQPAQTTPVETQATGKTLPQTGTDNKTSAMLSALGASVLGALGLNEVRKRKKKTSK